MTLNSKKRNSTKEGDGCVERRRLVPQRRITIGRTPKTNPIWKQCKSLQGVVSDTVLRGGAGSAVRNAGLRN